MKDERIRRSFRMAGLFSLLVCCIFCATMIFMATSFVILHHLGYNSKDNPFLPVFIFAISSIVLGTFFSRILGSKALSSIVSTSEATKEVAHGNYNIRLDENIKALEIREMAHNFNLMTEELAKTEILRSDFVSNVSHEFKTPLSAIEGYAMLLQNKNLSEEKHNLYLTKIIENVKRMSGLTGNILELSRLDNQSFALKKEKFSLDEQLRETILLFESQWSDKNINLDINLPETAIFGNAELLGEVWQNLIANALKFTDKSGNICIAIEKHGGYCRVTVADDGIGMNEETRKRVFERFYQGDTSHGTQGNGLGLTLVKRVVDLHSGSITVTSAPGKGTAITVTLPTV